MQTNEREKIIENLKDCNCDKALADKFMANLDAGRIKEALRILEKHRKDLLECFHKYNDHIVRLDYLAHQLEKTVSEEKDQ